MCATLYQNKRRHKHTPHAQRNLEMKVKFQSELEIFGIFANFSVNRLI